MNPCSTKTIQKITARNNATVGVVNPESSEKIFLFSKGWASDIFALERRKIVIADKTAISKKPNFQNSEYGLEISHPKPVFTTKIPIIKEASTLFIVFANDFSSEILFLMIPKTQIFPMAKQAPIMANHSL